MDRKELQNLLSIKGIMLDDAHILKLEEYTDYILEKNRDINLTAVKDKGAFLEKMVFDSLLPLTFLDLNDKKIIDVGTGAGFPGMVISLAKDVKIDLLDSTAKKLKVIDGFNNELARTINDRVEEFSKNNREIYDVVIARAVAPLNILLELCMPLVKVGGVFVAMKGADGINELNISKSAIEKLGGSLELTDNQFLPSGDNRINFMFKKIKATNHKYPRTFGEMKKKPL